MRSIPQRLLLAGLTVLLLVPHGFAQQQSGRGNTGSTGGASRTPQPNLPSTRSTTTTTPQRGVERDRGIVFISGRVVTEEGTPPPEIVSIDRVCGGNERREGYTDGNGFFSLQLGNNVGTVMQDASFSGGDFGTQFGMDPASPMGSGMRSEPGLTESELMGCDLKATLPGYQSTRLPLVSVRLRTPNDVGTIVIYSQNRSKATTISVTSMQAPKDAKKALDKGRDHLKKQKVEAAQKEFEKAVALYPRYAEAWFDLGLTHEIAGSKEEARKHYRQALEIDEHFIRPYVQLAGFALMENNYPVVLELTNKALSLNPFEYPAIHFFNAVANFNLQNFDAAERSAKKTDLLDGREQFPRNHLLLSRLHAHKGDYREAAEQIKTYLQLQPDGPDQKEVKAELEQMETLMKSAAKPAE